MAPSSIHRLAKPPFNSRSAKTRVIPGFEKAVIGMKVGDSKTVTILAADAYGPRNEGLVQVVPKTQLPAGSDPKVGMQLQGSNPDGSSTVFTIIKVDDMTVNFGRKFGPCRERPHL